MSQQHFDRVHSFNTIPVLHPAIFYDDCNGTFAYKVTAGPAGWVADYTLEWPYVGLKALEMHCSNVDPYVGEYVEIHKSLLQPPTQLARLQIIFCQPAGGPANFTNFTLHWRVPERVYMAQVQCDTLTKHILYAHSWAPAFTDSGLRFNNGIRWWNHLDLSMNLLTHRYHRLSLNGYALDLSAIPLPYAVSSYNPSLTFTIKVTNQAAVASHMLFDQILITPENP